MTCEAVRDHLEAYLDGGLDRGLRDAVDRHLAACDGCRADLEALQGLRPAIAALPREIAPPRDLWQGIGPRLRPAGIGRRIEIPVWILVAAGLLLVAASSTLTVTLTRREAASAPDPFSADEARYLQVSSDLSALYARQRDSLAPETRAVLERNLATVERALREAREALDRDPSNPALEAVVLAAYRQKIDLLQRASSLDRGG